MPSGSEVNITFNANGSYVSECQYSNYRSRWDCRFDTGPNLTGTTDIIVPDCAPGLVIEWSPTSTLNDAGILNPEMTLNGSTSLTLSVYPVGFPLCAATDDIQINLSANPDAGTDSEISFCSAGAPADLFFNWALQQILLGLGLTQVETQQQCLLTPQQWPLEIIYMLLMQAGARYSYCLHNLNVSAITSTNSIGASCTSTADGSITLTGDNIDFYSVNGGAFLPTSSPLEINGLTAGSYTVVVNSNDGCTDTETVDVSQPDILVLTSVAIDASCFGLCDGQSSMTAAGGTPNYIYNWTPGVIGNQAGNSTTLCAGSYTAGVTDENDCSAETSFIIEEPSDVIVSIDVEVSSGCAPHQASFINNTASDAVVSTFVDYGDNTAESINGLAGFSHIYESPGLYDITITITTTSGCSYTEVYNQFIEVYNNPVAGFYVNPNNISSLEPNTNFYNSSSADALSFLWSIYEGSPSSSTDENVENVSYLTGVPGDHPVNLIVSNSEGCIDNIQGTVKHSK